MNETKDTLAIHIEFANKYIHWGIDRFICGPEGQGSTVGQARKMFEEASETLVAMSDEDEAEVIDGLGDTFVTMVMVSERCGINPAEWMKVVWTDGGTRIQLPPTDHGDLPIQYAAAILQGAADTMIEVVSAKMSGNTDRVFDTLGASYVGLNLVCKMTGLSLASCMDAAWNAIKDRKGRMVNGKFVKEAA